jgi:glycosyltransferase involved in cell wall biosynthesis
LGVTKKAPPLFSVVIPSHDRINFLLRSLDTVWSQTFTDFEVIVVDDGSTDGTSKQLAGVSERVRLISQANRGPGSARNFGANVARGKYVAFLDSDDLWFPWTLATFSELISRHGTPSILSGKLVEFSREKALESVKQEPIAADVFPDYIASSRAQYFVGAGMAVLRRDVFLSSGGFFDERVNCEDHDLILRLGLAPGFVQVLAPTTLAWRRHSTSETCDYRRTFRGISGIVEQERRGAYPGGVMCARARREILTFHTRPITLNGLRANLVADSWSLYATTLKWNWQLGRWRYIALFPILLLLGVLRSKCGRGRERVHSR